MNKNELQNLHMIIHRALEEDLGDGDITTLSTVPARIGTQRKIYRKRIRYHCRT